MNDIKIKLKKDFSQFKLDVDFNAKSGQLISIVGPSGCGKSTTLQLITGLLQMEEGEIIIKNENLANKPVNEREIAMVFQNYSLYPHLNVAKNIAYPLKIKKIKKQERLEKVTQLLALVGLTGFEKRKIDSLSGGECQRVALARALASSPKLLLLDEPLSALDAKLRTYLRDEIKRIHDETKLTMIYVTHDQTEALSISDKIFVMNNGKIEMEGTAEEIYNNPKTLFTASFMGEGNIISSNLILPLLDEEVSNNENLKFFFRPEKAFIIEETKYQIPELLPHIVLENVEITKVEFLGNKYRIKAQYKGENLIIDSSYKPKKQSISLSIRKKDLKRFLNSNLVN